MGGSSSPPFLYDPVSQWSFNDYHRGKSFNPKAVTQASRAPRPQSIPQEGPLVNFNRHPDTVRVANSWVAVLQKESMLITITVGCAPSKHPYTSYEPSHQGPGDAHKKISAFSPSLVCTRSTWYFVLRYLHQPYRRRFRMDHSCCSKSAQIWKHVQIANV